MVRVCLLGLGFACLYCFCMYGTRVCARGPKCDQVCPGGPMGPSVPTCAHVCTNEMAAVAHVTQLRPCQSTNKNACNYVWLGMMCTRGINPGTRGKTFLTWAQSGHIGPIGVMGAVGPVGPIGPMTRARSINNPMFVSVYIRAKLRLKAERKSRGKVKTRRRKRRQKAR